MLSTFYLLKIRFNVQDDKLKRLEPALHAFPILFALSTSITALAKRLYGNVFWTCWINPDPPQPDFRYYQWFFLFAPVWICIIYQTSVMSTIWWTMRSQEKKMALKYQLESEPMSPGTSHSRELHASSESNNDYSSNEHEGGATANDEDSRAFANESQRIANKFRKMKIENRRSSIINKRKWRHSQMIATQGMLYVCAFYITWLFPTVQRIMELMGLPGNFVIQALDTCLLPLQGFLNVFIYVRPKYLFYRRKHPNLPFRLILRIVSNPRKESKIVAGYYLNLSKVSSVSSGQGMGSGLRSNNLGLRSHTSCSHPRSFISALGFIRSSAIFSSVMTNKEDSSEADSSQSGNEGKEHKDKENQNVSISPTDVESHGTPRTSDEADAGFDDSFAGDDDHVPEDQREAYESFEERLMPDVQDEFPDLDFIDYRKMILEKWRHCSGHV